LLLVTALLRSKHGMATRRRRYMAKAGHEKFEYHVAFATDTGLVFIINGRNGVIRKIQMVDQAQDDWEPCMEVGEPKLVKRRRIKPAEEEPK